MNTIAVLGTFDTKGDEHAFLAQRIREAGCEVLLIDVGTGDAPRLQPDISRFDVANASGLNLQPILDRHDRGEAVTAMARAVPICIENLRLAGRIQGIISLGGGGGTAIASAAMRALPIGFPKLIVSTLASGNIAAARVGVPAVVAPGCLDMVNFGEPTSVSQHFQKRTFYQHNPQVTLMRTTPDECRELGEILARSVNRYSAPTTVLIPTRAISIISASGEPFHDPMADRALFESIQNHLEPHILVKALDLTINDPAFAQIAAETLLTNIREHERLIPPEKHKTGT